MGRMVGVKWLYSACGECEICLIRYCYCPHQKNSGSVSDGGFNGEQAEFVFRMFQGLSNVRGTDPPFVADLKLI
jgi:D-arabinose 1-dehydrogenase-like Zn-dependent alcohol dehydrogenase